MSDENSPIHPAHFQDGGPPVLAGFGRRAVALIIDLVILYYPLAIAFCLPSILLVLLSESRVITPDFDHLIIAMALGILLFFLAWWVHSALSDSGKHQASLGKRFLGLRVIRLDGQPVSFQQATIRFLGKLLSIGLLFGGYLIQPFTARKQTLHDLIAGTLVIRKGPTEAQSSS